MHILTVNCAFIYNNDDCMVCLCNGFDSILLNNASHTCPNIYKKKLNGKIYNEIQHNKKKVTQNMIMFIKFKYDMG